MGLFSKPDHQHPQLITAYFGFIGVSESSKPVVSLDKNKVDYIYTVKNNADASHWSLKLASQSEKEEFTVSPSAKHFHKLEKWMLSLPGFPEKNYETLKDMKTFEKGELLWERKVKTETPYRSPYFGAKVSILWGQIMVDRNNGHNENIATKDIDYITIDSFSEKEPTKDFYLNFRSHSAPAVSVTNKATGFKKLEKWLFSLEDFDKNSYEKAVKNVSNNSTLIWRKKPVPTAKLISHQGIDAFEKLDEGIWLENEERLIPWGSFHEFSEEKGVFKTTKKMPNPSFKQYEYVLKDVVVLNGLRINKLKVTAPAFVDSKKFNPNWPVTQFSADAILGDADEKDFKRLFSHFSNYLGRPTTNHETETSKTTSWELGRTLLRLQTWKPYQLEEYRPGCWLTIEYEPDLTKFYTDEYQQNVEINPTLQFLPLVAEFTIAHDYLHQTQARYTPSCFLHLFKGSEKALVWQDERHGKIGFANAEYCHIYQHSEVFKFVVTAHFWRDELRDYSLSLKTTKGFHNEYVASLYFTETDIESIIQKVGQVLQLEHEFAEDRQYY